MSLNEVLQKYREEAFSERDKGTRFERLMQRYLKTDPIYANQFKEVYLWNEFPFRSEFGRGDIGIDLVAKTTEDTYWAIQCKFYQEEASINKPEVDTFITTSGRKFKNEYNEEIRFVHRLWISTTYKWSTNAEEAIKNQEPPVSRLNLFDLFGAPVDWKKLEDGIHGKLARTPLKTLFPHQKEAVEKTNTYFKEQNRGKLIMACGTGKTFTSLRIAEKETNNQGLILFLVPSIALLGQTLRAWSADAQVPINPIAICSDPKITKIKKSIPDIDSFSIVNLAYPASTNSKTILKQFEEIKQNDKEGMTVVFSTYQSIDVIAETQKALLKNGFPQFDLIICDESHRTTVTVN